MEKLVVAIDPGREKCGLAVVHKGDGVLHKAIINTPELIDSIKLITGKYHTNLIALGAGTSSAKVRNQLQAAICNINIIVVDEYRTTDAARMRYWQENPPGGFKRFIPVTMLVPPVPVDDYAAVIIAEKYLDTEHLR